MSPRFLRYAIVGVLGISIGGAGAIFASALIPADGVIHACYQRSTGILRVVADPSECRGSETAISWNQVGPQGATGATGATGAVGPSGPIGANGANGTNGQDGATGPTGASGPAGANGLNGAPGPTGPAGATGATGPAGVGAIASLNSLNGLPCGADSTGTTRVVYSGGNVAIFCDAPPPPPNFQPPVFTDVSVGGNVASVTFSKPVCRTAPWTPVFWQVIANGIVQDLDIADNIPICTAAADNGVPNASVFLVTAPSPGSFVAVTLTQAAHFDLRDAAGNPPNTPQTRTATAGAPETVPPTLVSAAGNLGTFIVHFTFSEPVWCTGFVPSDYVVTDNNPATTDPIVVGMSSNDPCGTTQISAHRTFAVQLSAPLPGDTTFTALLLPQPGEIRDISGNSLPNPSSATFNTGTPDFTPPTLTDTRVVNNIASTDFSDVGDAFTVTFSEKMNGSIFGLIPIVDQDGSTATISCGNNASCTWNIAVTTMTVTLTQTLANSGGTTPGLQLPATISALIGLADVAGNAPDLAGSADRVIDVEP